MKANRNERPTHLDLFSGIGGFALAAQWAGFRTIGFCEIDKYCQKVLTKHWPGAKIWEDIRNFRFGFCDLITGGFPCQPFSVAGKQRGKKDDRYLWPEMLRIIKISKPTWVVAENPIGIVQMELDQVLFDLENIGYSTTPITIPACAVEADHIRERVWILAYSAGIGFNGSKIREGTTQVNDGTKKGEKETKRFEGRFGLRSGIWGDEPAIWRTESRMDGKVNGIPYRMDRIKGLGNAIVPQVAYEILREIRKLI